MIKQALIVIAAMAVNPSWAINKCTGSDGKSVFQDTPCQGQGVQLQVKPASGHDQPKPLSETTPATGSATASPQTEAQRLNAQAEKLRAARRVEEMELVILPRAYSAQNELRTSCDTQIQNLRRKKASANNNLAGATWEQSLSTEMAAVATRCDTRGREIQADIDVLLQTCRVLGGCK